MVVVVCSRWCVCGDSDRWMDAGDSNVEERLRLNKRKSVEDKWRLNLSQTQFLWFKCEEEMRKCTYKGM